MRMGNLPIVNFLLSNLGHLYFNSSLQKNSTSSLFFQVIINLHRIWFCIVPKPQGEWKFHRLSLESMVIPFLWNVTCYTRKALDFLVSNGVFVPITWFKSATPIVTPLQDDSKTPGVRSDQCVMKKFEASPTDMYHRRTRRYAIPTEEFIRSRQDLKGSYLQIPPHLRSDCCWVIKVTQ